MFVVELRNRTDVEDFVRGCAFYGTGGGGSCEDGMRALLNQLENGRRLGWISADSLSEELNVVSPFLMGSIAPLSEETEFEMSKFGLYDEKYSFTECLINAIRVMENLTSKAIGALIPAEIGGMNTPVCMAVGAEMGLPVIDGDYSGGRAIPEMRQGTLKIYGKNFLPVVSADKWGNISVLEAAVNELMVERIGKYLSIASFGMTGNAAYLMSAQDSKEVAVSGTLTRSFSTGRKIRESHEALKDPVSEIADYLDCFVICRGKLMDKKSQDRDGYYWGETIVRGMGAYEGTVAKIWFKNENHICWVNDMLTASSPDKIIVIDDKTGEPYTNTVTEVGLDVAVLCDKACSLYRSDAGIELMGPRAFGFDFDYVPVENNIKNKEEVG